MSKLYKTRKAFAQEIPELQQQCNLLSETCQIQAMEFDSADEALDTQNLILFRNENFRKGVVAYSFDTNYRYTSYNQKHAVKMKLLWGIENERPRKRAIEVSIES